MKVLLADRPGSWRDGLAAALEREHLAVSITARGDEVRRALTDHPKEALVVVGSELEGLAGLDAIYLAHTDRVAANTMPPRSLLLVAEVRSDIELLELFRERGVTDFVFRSDPIESTAAKILANASPERRPVPRKVVRIDARMRAGTVWIEGTVRDLNTQGATLASAKRGDLRRPTIGEVVDLELSFGTLREIFRVEVRRLSLVRDFFGAQLVVGSKFLDLSDGQHAILNQVIGGALQEIEECAARLAENVRRRVRARVDSCPTCIQRRSRRVRAA